MHREAWDFLKTARALLPTAALVCELGGRDVNGSVRDLYAGVPLYVGVDLLPGNGVDAVADAREWRPPSWLRFDLVLCTEVLEHAPEAGRICETAWEILRPGGTLVLTCAGPRRQPHSGIDGEGVREGEHYHNPSADELRGWLHRFPAVLLYSREDLDLYAIAGKGVD